MHFLKMASCFEAEQDTDHAQLTIHSPLTTHDCKQQPGIHQRQQARRTRHTDHHVSSANDSFRAQFATSPMRAWTMRLACRGASLSELDLAS